MGYFNQINFIITLVMVMMMTETMGGINKTKKINKKINKTKTPPLVLKMEPNNPLVFNNYINITHSNVGINLFGDIEKYHGDRYGNGLLKMFNFKNGKITNVFKNITKHNITIGHAGSKCTPDGLRCISSSYCCSNYCAIMVQYRICIGVPIPLIYYLQQFKWSKVTLNNSNIVDNVTKTTTSQQQEQPNNNHYNNKTYPECSVNETEEMYNRKRGGIPEEIYRWRRGFFVYISSEFSQSSVEIIISALNHIYYYVAGYCFNIYIWPPGSTPTKEHVIIRRGLGGCSSSVGKQENQPQYVNLEDGCVYLSTVIHELLHALGLWHEQSRPDRDKFINIHKENIKDGKLHNFDRKDTSLTFGSEYGYDSIMHYHSREFSSNGKNTITKKDGGVIGYNEEIARTDFRKLYRMYCSGK